MDLELLRRFHIVAECKNITHASKRLSIAPSALSKSISLFEHRIGFELFSRTRAGLELNPKGHELFDYAKDLFEKAAIFEKKFLDDEKNMTGEISIVTFPYIGTDIIIPKLHIIRSKFPDLRVQLRLDPYDVVPVSEDISISSYLDNVTDIHQKELCQSINKLYASQEYLEKNGYPKSIDDLENHKFVIYKDFGSQNPHKRSGILHKFLKDNKKNIILEVNSLSSVIRACQDGVGISEIPEIPGASELKLTHIIPDLVGNNTPLYYTYRKNRSRSLKIDNLFKFFLDHVFK